MKMKLVSQAGNEHSSIENKIQSACKGLNLDRLDVAVAYATMPGLKLLELALGGLPSKSRWVIGLDDAITQPEAIEYLMQLRGSKVRVGKMSAATRFHPKLYCLWSSSFDDQCISVVGSGNLTLNGLRTNGETAAILIAESKSEAMQLKKQWKNMWQLGEELDLEQLQSYRELYMQAKKLRKKLIKLGVVPPDQSLDDKIEEKPSYNGNPESAHIAWLEAGTASAGGRDLEFPKKMMPFFELSRKKETRKFLMATGAEHELTFTERMDNQMWRLLFSSASIRAAIGRDTMRPESGVNRSDLAVVFRKINGSKNFQVEMLKADSSAFIDLVQKSKSINASFVTTKRPGGRKFGFY